VCFAIGWRSSSALLQKPSAPVSAPKKDAQAELDDLLSDLATGPSKPAAPAPAAAPKPAPIVSKVCTIVAFFVGDLSVLIVFFGCVVCLLSIVFCCCFFFVFCCLLLFSVVFCPICVSLLNLSLLFHIVFLMCCLSFVFCCCLLLFSVVFLPICVSLLNLSLLFHIVFLMCCLSFVFCCLLLFSVVFCCFLAYLCFSLCDAVSDVFVLAACGGVERIGRLAERFGCAAAARQSAAASTTAAAANATCSKGIIGFLFAYCVLDFAFLRLIWNLVFFYCFGLAHLNSACCHGCAARSQACSRQGLVVARVEKRWI
jgi:hypothetical protein